MSSLAHPYTNLSNYENVQTVGEEFPSVPISVVPGATQGTPILQSFIIQGLGFQSLIIQGIGASQ